MGVHVWFETNVRGTKWKGVARQGFHWTGDRVEGVRLTSFCAFFCRGLGETNATADGGAIVVGKVFNYGFEMLGGEFGGFRRGREQPLSCRVYLGV
jgi:hypothetical protein